MDKQQDVLAILKLYELRRDPEMRKARQWYLTEFSPESAMDIIGLLQAGERASANFRMVGSYWDMASSLVLNGGIDEKLFLGANTEHIVVFAKIEPHINEIREIIKEPDYLIYLETLCKKMPDYEQKLASRKRLGETWKTASRN